MRSFFPFYGGKWRATAKGLYSAPRYPVVIEPFAGAAGYATYYEPAACLLGDVDPRIVGVWDYLVHVSEREMLALPNLRVGMDLRELTIPQEAKWFMGFWANRGSSTPCHRVTKMGAHPQVRKEWQRSVAEQLYKIRGWTAVLMPYENWPAFKGTWFIDPPYSAEGNHYSYNHLDYKRLGSWCRDRKGQIIVCEAKEANWLPFEPLGRVRSMTGKSAEVVWRRG